MGFNSSRPRTFFLMAGASLLLAILLMVGLGYARGVLPAGQIRVLGGLVGVLNVASLLAFSMGVLGLRERRTASRSDQAPAAQPGGADLPSAAQPGGADLPLTLHRKRMVPLMAMFDFTLADLAANREGRMTPRQQRRLRSIANGRIMAATFFMGIFVIIVVKVAFSTARPLEIAWLAVVVPAICAIGVRLSIRQLLASTISVAEGLVNHYEILQQTKNGPSTLHITHLGDVDFYFSVEERTRFKQGQPYRIYYTGHSTVATRPIIFSVEALRPADQLQLVRVNPFRPDEEYYPPQISEW